MGNTNEIPKWVQNTRADVTDIKLLLEKQKKKDQAEAKRGLEKVKKTDELIIEADYISQVVNQDHDSGFWEDEIVSASGIRLEFGIRSLKEDLIDAQKEGESLYNLVEDYHAKYYGVVTSTDGSSGSAVFLSASIEKRNSIIEPAYHPININTNIKLLTSRDSIYKDLLKVISEFDEKYKLMIEGSETTLNYDSPDNLAQAAHSMRDCFQSIIEELAPTKVVKTQSWFTSTEGAPSGVSRRSRLRFIFYGSGENVDEKLITRLNNQADIAKDSLDLIIGRAHDHDPSLDKDEVVIAIDQARFSLLNVLKAYLDYRSK